VVVVDAGQCTNLHESVQSHSSKSKSNGVGRTWDETKVVDFVVNDGAGSKSTGSSGRGQTLNFGAAHSSGTVLIFLHSDCKLPPGWDQKIWETLGMPKTSHSRSYSSAKEATASGSNGGQIGSVNSLEAVVHACAFRMGVDTDGLSGSKGYPWGIDAVRFLANVRTEYFCMPYGDQAISIPACYFRYLGGFRKQ